MSGLLRLAALTLLAASCSAAADRYAGSQVLRVKAETMEQLAFLNGLQANSTLDFWREPRMLGSVDIRAERWEVDELKSSLHKQGLNYYVHIEDVSALVAENDRLQVLARSSSDKSMDWESYHTLEEISAWIDQLAVDYPDLATVTEVGESYEGRTMKLLKLSKGGVGKEAIFTDGGIHAREWISPAVVTYMINELVSGNDEGILDSVDLYFMVPINPDGYAFTFSDERLWRKTRSPNTPYNCYGSDPNRNWGYHWGESGSSSFPCSDIYAGSEAFSEVEMRNVRDAMLEIKPRMYLTFHSYSQIWMYPWGYTFDFPDNVDDLKSLATSAADALMAVFGTPFAVGSATETLHSTSAGGSDDWALGSGLVEYAYCIELRDKGYYGFLLPPDQIEDSGRETYEGFKVVAKFVADNPVRK